MSLYFRELSLQDNQTLTESELIDLQKLDDSFAQNFYLSYSIPHTKTYVAWFNGHILAAAQIKFSESTSFENTNSFQNTQSFQSTKNFQNTSRAQEENKSRAEIIFFKVRDVTLRRGVGSFLLDELTNQYPQINRWEFITPNTLTLEAKHSLNNFINAYSKQQGSVGEFVLKAES